MLGYAYNNRKICVLMLCPAGWHENDHHIHLLGLCVATSTDNPWNRCRMDPKWLRFVKYPFRFWDCKKIVSYSSCNRRRNSESVVWILCFYASTRMITGLWLQQRWNPSPTHVVYMAAAFRSEVISITFESYIVPCGTWTISAHTVV